MYSGKGFILEASVEQGEDDYRSTSLFMEVDIVRKHISVGYDDGTVILTVQEATAFVEAMQMLIDRINDK